MALSEKTKRTMTRIWNVFTSVVVALAILLAVILVGFRLFGFQIFTVLSGSMEPDLPVGSLVYVQSVDPTTLQVGDDISYLVAENTVVTHRIVEILPDEEDPSILRFSTQGIANETVDTTPPVHMNNIIGKVAFHLPLLGYLTAWVQGVPGRYITVAFASVLILVTFLPDILAPFLAKNKTSEQDIHTKEGKHDFDQ